jgi:hypothetical protein
VRPFSFILISLASAGTGWAGRPLATEDAYTVGARALELEFGLEYADVPAECRQYGHGFVATYGLANAVDVALEIPVVLSKPEGNNEVFGVGDVAARAKFRLAEAGFLTLAVVPEVKFATGDEDRGLGSGSSDVAALVAASCALGITTLHGNVGYNRAFPKEGEAEGCFFAAAATEVALLGPLAVAAEFLADLAEEENEKEEGGGYPMAVGGGFSFAVFENLALDAGITRGLGAADGETSATIGATWGVF